MSSPKSVGADRKNAHQVTLFPDLAGKIDQLLDAGVTNLEARIIDEARREAICRVLRHTNCHLSRSRKIQGINRKTLRKRLFELGISPEEILPDGCRPEDHEPGDNVRVPA